uniref:AC_N domain-containing protein n=1 Tax=Heterorhabditis bacteriophora TaxID=37862 RepID=A0A1I7X6W0_HETBA
MNGGVALRTALAFNLTPTQDYSVYVESNTKCLQVVTSSQTSVAKHENCSFSDSLVSNASSDRKCACLTLLACVLCHLVMLLRRSLSKRLLANRMVNYRSLEMGRADALEPLRGGWNKEEFSQELLEALDDLADDESLALEACREDSLYPVYFEHINAGRMQFALLFLFSLCMVETIVTGLLQEWIFLFVLIITDVIVLGITIFYKGKSQALSSVVIICSVILLGCAPFILHSSMTVLILFLCYTLLPIPFLPTVRLWRVDNIYQKTAVKQRFTFKVLAAAVVSAMGLAIQIPNAEHLATDALLFFGINIVGFFVYYPTELVQRKTFRETRKCVETRMMLVRELDKQEKILLSVLPKHIAYEHKQCIQQ